MRMSMNLWILSPVTGILLPLRGENIFVFLVYLPEFIQISQRCSYAIEGPFLSISGHGKMWAKAKMETRKLAYSGIS